jgi:hypothetical protein
MGQRAIKAGFTPCLSVTHLITADRRNHDHPLSAYDVAKRSAQHIQLNRMSDNFGMLTSIQTSTELKMTPNIPIKKNKAIIIADCHHAEVHKTLSLTHLKYSTLIHLIQPLRYTYTSPIYVGEWLEEQWFTQPNKKGVHALFYDDGHPEELTDNIHRMQVNVSEVANKTRFDIIMEVEKEVPYQFSLVVRGS